MATYTTYKNLEKPLSTEKYNVGVANKNNDVIDSELHKLELKNESQDNLLATKESLNEHVSDEDNPHNVTKSQVGLANVDNTSDLNKPVSIAQQTAINESLIQADQYTDRKIAELINGAPETLDTLKEVADAIEENETIVEALDAAIGTKANQSELTAHIGNDIIHVTQNNKDDWNAAKDHAGSIHARIDATKVEQSEINGNIIVDGKEVTIYTPDILTTMQSVENNTSEGKLVDALVVKELNNKGSQVSVYKGNDGNLHFTDWNGADTVIPFKYTNNIVNEVLIFDYSNKSTLSSSPETLTNKIYARQPYLGAKLKEIVLTSYIWSLSPNSKVKDPLYLGSYNSSDTVYFYIDFEYLDKITKKTKIIERIFSFSAKNINTSISIDNSKYTLPQDIVEEMEIGWFYTNINFRLSRNYNIKVNTVLGINFVYE